MNSEKLNSIAIDDGGLWLKEAKARARNRKRWGKLWKFKLRLSIKYYRIKGKIKRLKYQNSR